MTDVPVLNPEEAGNAYTKLVKKLATLDEESKELWDDINPSEMHPNSIIVAHTRKEVMKFIMTQVDEIEKELRGSN